MNDPSVEEDYAAATNRLVTIISYLATADSKASIAELCAEARNMIQAIQIYGEDVTLAEQTRLVQKAPASIGPIGDLCSAARKICDRMSAEEIELACEAVLQTLARIERDHGILNFPRKAHLRLVK